MKNPAEMREEVQHLQMRAARTTEARALLEIQALMAELERRIIEHGNGHEPTPWRPIRPNIPPVLRIYPH